MSACPSLRELQDEKRQRWIRSQESRIRSEARALGISRPDDPDLWALLRRKHAYQDELRRPKLEARAKRLGVPTRGLFGGKRGITQISLDCYREEDRARLCRELGYS